MVEQHPIGKTIWERFPSLREVPQERFPNHILIIPDGNGRWAKRINSLPAIGHRQGFKVLKEVLQSLQELPIPIITIWGFACDNWKRPKEEVDSLMKIFEEGLMDMRTDLIKDNNRFVHLGRKDRIPGSLREVIEYTETATKNNNGKIICIAIDFGGEDQELRVMEKVRKIPQDTPITTALLRTLRDGEGTVSPADLVIRTSGEHRTSDIGWLGQNSELFFIPSLLPNTNVQNFLDAVIDFSKRERRFGGRLYS